MYYRVLKCLSTCRSFCLHALPIVRASRRSSAHLHLPGQPPPRDVYCPHHALLQDGGGGGDGDGYGRGSGDGDEDAGGGNSNSEGVDDAGGNCGSGD